MLKSILKCGLQLSEWGTLHLCLSLPILLNHSCQHSAILLLPKTQISPSDVYGSPSVFFFLNPCYLGHNRLKRFKAYVLSSKTAILSKSMEKAKRAQDLYLRCWIKSHGHAIFLWSFYKLCLASDSPSPFKLLFYEPLQAAHWTPSRLLFIYLLKHCWPTFQYKKNPKVVYQSKCKKMH